jgi:AraC-like DNA-binding protein
MTLALPDVVSFIAIFLFWLVTVFLLSRRSSLRSGSWLLAVFLASKSLCFLHGLLLRFAPQIAPLTPHVFHWGFSFEFLLGPSLYLYTRSLVSGGFQARPRSALHLIPFAAHFGFMLITYHRLAGPAKLAILRSGQLYSPNAQQLLDTMVFVHFLAYGVAAGALLLQHRQRVRDVYSQLEHRRLTWLTTLLAYFLVIWIVSYVDLTLRFLGSGVPHVPFFVFDLLLLSFATMIVFFALRQPELFGKDAALPAATGNGRPNDKEARPRLQAEDRTRLLEKLARTMARERPYLDPDVTLAALARCAGMPARDLTSLLREGLGTCFYDYVNRHRIEEAKRLLAENGQGASVIEVLQQAGFNSKSVFNTAFKRMTGMTPTEYRRSQPTTH